jgi:CheY-like chemotaxis protein
MFTRMPKGCYVFLVEDEIMIRMMVADMLEELGYSVAAEAGRIEEALELVQRTEFDIAIMDINLVDPAGRISRSAGIAKAVSDRNPGKTT